jgi:long-chain fatty acid transport protein
LWITRADTEESGLRDTVGKMLRSVSYVLFLIAAVLAVRPVAAQGNFAVQGVLAINPGARSVGIGGAFAAIADDATAAFANPAGLVQIGRPEISAELRATITSDDDPLLGYSGPEISGLGFFAFVYPAEKWAVAVYSHQLAIVDLVTAAPIVLQQEFTVTSYAAAGAYKLNEELSLGLGIAYFNGDRKDAGSGSISDTDWGVNAGLLWHPLPSWSFGGFYRQGPEFAVDDGPFATARSLALKNAGGSFDFPTVAGVGAAFQPGRGAWTIAFEWDHVGTASEPGFEGSTVFGGGDDVHLGVEFAVLNWRPVLAIRGGIWQEGGRDSEIISGAATFVQTSAGDLTHTAFGLGLAYKRFQFDFGVDISDLPNIVSFSVVFSF